MLLSLHERKSLEGDGFSLDGSPFAKLKDREKCLIKSQTLLLLEAAAGLARRCEDFSFFFHFYAQIFIYCIHQWSETPLPLCK